MEQTNSRPRLRDVADQAGVSPATASRALNGSQGVGASNRRRILAAARELDYRPNLLASGLRRSKWDALGVVVSDIENPHFTAMIRAVEDAANPSGLAVLVCNTDDDSGKQTDYLLRLAAQRVRGVLISPFDASAPEIGQLLDLGIPVVAFDRAVTDVRADAVVANNHGGARRATQILIVAGHRRIGFISGPESLETGADRLAGYRGAMIEAGLEPQVAFGGFREAGGYRAAMELLGASGLTSLSVANNLMTLGALTALRERGLRIPDDVSLIAIDDPNWAPLLEPPLTTLAQPVEEMARKAVELLLERASGARTTPVRLVYDLELHARGSVAPPSSRPAKHRRGRRDEARANRG